jgi:pimeloyl-ACP methyl ester carboxylesterase
MTSWPTEITAGGKRLECAGYGPVPGQAPTIVLLHEGLGCLALWRDFPERLAAATGWGVFAYSRAGYGRSEAAALPRPLDYMTLEARDVLPEVLAAIGFETGILMGHSDGATIAAEYPGNHEDHRVRGLVVMAPHFFTEAGGLASIAEAKEAFAAGDLREKMAKYHDDAEATFRGWNDAWLDPGFRDWHVGEVIDYWRVPCLAIQGADDQYGTLRQIEEIETRSYAPVETLILPGVKHAPHAEATEAVLAAVTEFTVRLARIEAAQPEAVPA